MVVLWHSAQQPNNVKDKIEKGENMLVLLELIFQMTNVVISLTYVCTGLAISKDFGSCWSFMKIFVFV